MGIWLSDEKRGTTPYDWAKDERQPAKKGTNEIGGRPAQHLSHWSDSEWECQLLEQRLRYAETR